MSRACVKLLEGFRSTGRQVANSHRHVKSVTGTRVSDFVTTADGVRRVGGVLKRPVPAVGQADVRPTSPPFVPNTL